MSPETAELPGPPGANFLAEIRDAHGVELAELDLGGGHGIAYTEADEPRTPEDIATYQASRHVARKSGAAA